MRPIPTRLALLACLALASATAWGQGRVLYGCAGEGGKRNFYTSEKSETLGKNCVVVEEKVSSAPASAPAAPPAARQPATAARVDPNTQKSRDDGRRKILQSELDDEEKRLAAARRKLEEQQGIRNGDERNYQRVLDRLKPFQEAVEQHEKNVAELRKTLSGLR
jgi:hypothetical protein